MDAKKELKKFLLHTNYLIPGLLLLAVTLPLLAILLIGYGVGVDRAVPFSETAEPKTYATVEIIGLSSLRLDEAGASYYLALDTDYSLHILRLRDSMAKKLSPYIDYARDPSSPAPCPSRLYGIVRPLSPTAYGKLIETFKLPKELEGYDSLNSLDVLFAPHLIDTDLFFNLVLFFSLFSLAFIGQYIYDHRTTRRCLSRLNKIGSLERAAMELSAPNNILFCKGNSVLSRSFIFCRYSGAVVRYDDLIWCTTWELHKSGGTRVELIGYTQGNKRMVIALSAGRDKRKPAEPIAEIERIIIQRNPQIEFRKGYTTLSEDSITCYYSGASVRYDDLVWCYTRKSGKKSTPRVELIGYTREKIELILAISIGGKKDKPAEQIASIERIVLQRNPQILWGDTPDNRAAYDEICQIHS